MAPHTVPTWPLHRLLHRHHHVVEEAEPHGSLALCMMPRGSHLRQCMLQGTLQHLTQSMKCVAQPQACRHIPLRSSLRPSAQPPLCPCTNTCPRPAPTRPQCTLIPMAPPSYHTSVQQPLTIRNASAVFLKMYRPAPNPHTTPMHTHDDGTTIILHFCVAAFRHARCCCHVLAHVQARAQPPHGPDTHSQRWHHHRIAPLSSSQRPCVLPPPCPCTCTGQRPA